METNTHDDNRHQRMEHNDGIAVLPNTGWLRTALNLPSHAPSLTLWTLQHDEEERPVAQPRTTRNKDGLESNHFDPSTTIITTTTTTAHRFETSLPCGWGCYYCFSCCWRRYFGSSSWSFSSLSQAGGEGGRRGPPYQHVHEEIALEWNGHEPDWIRAQWLDRQESALMVPLQYGLAHVLFPSSSSCSFFGCCGRQNCTSIRSTSSSSVSSSVPSSYCTIL